MNQLLSIEDLSFDLPDGSPLLRSISLAVEEGRMVWIAGPSGGGKTTLLRIINRLESETSGKLEFAGRTYQDWPPTRLRQSLVLMPQMPVMVKGSLEDNLLLPFRLKAAADRDRPDRERLRKTLEGLGLGGLSLERGVEGLSVGQSQRIGLGRVLLLEPRMILMDEPLASLDKESRRLVEEAVAGFVSGGGSVIMVSHIPPVRDPDQCYSLAEGRLLGCLKESLL